MSLKKEGVGRPWHSATLHCQVLLNPTTSHTQNVGSHTVRQICLTILMLGATSQIFCQTLLLNANTKTEIEVFEQRYFSKLKKRYSKYITNKSDYEILYIFGFRLPHLGDTLDMKDFFKDGIFINRLQVIKGRKSKRNFLRGQSLAINDNSIILSGESWMVYEFPKAEWLNKNYVQIVEAYSRDKKTIFFHISGTNGSIYFYLADNSVYVIDINRNMTYDLVDFIDNHFDELLFIDLLD